MRPRFLPLALLAIVAFGGAATGDGPADRWGWLRASEPEDASVKFGPGLSPAEQDLGRTAARAIVTLLTLPAGQEPREGAAEATGFLVSNDGLFAAPWSVLSRARFLGGTTWLWGRTFDGPWERAVVLGGSYFGDVGLARLLTRQEDLWPLAFGATDREAAGKRFVVVGCPLRRRHVVCGAAATSVEWFDPREADGRVESRPGSPRSAVKGGFAIALRFAADLTTSGGEGSPVLDGAGKVVGVVSRRESGARGEEVVVATPVEVARPVLAAVDGEARYDPVDLGFRFVPLPAAPGTAPAIPGDLERMRAGKKERGGIVVGDVHEKSPALGTIWPGDLLLEIEGRPVFAEVPESLSIALLSLRGTAPVDLVLWRGGKRESIQVASVRGHEVYGDFQSEHDDRAGGLRPTSR